MNSIYFLLNFFIGACLASHANVIYERWYTHNFIFSRSYCDNCKSTLSLLDEIPLFSYLLLKGKCKYCQKNIPRELFFFELVGGFAFCTINFSDKSQIITSIFIFSLLLIAISDYYQNEFDLIFIFPAIITSILFNRIYLFNWIEWLSFLPVLIVLSIYSFKQKMGLGDLLIYVLISTYFTPTFANLTLLFAALILIIIHFTENNLVSHNYPFIPFIFIGLIISKFIFEQ